MLSVIYKPYMLSVIMLSVIVLNVVALWPGANVIHFWSAEVTQW
jgi:hypothetical protein